MSERYDAYLRGGGMLDYHDFVQGFTEGGAETWQFGAGPA